MTGEFRSRSEIARDAREASLRSWFGKRRWRVMSEFSGERRKQLPRKPGAPQQVAVLVYDQGEFWITSPHGVFQTALGHKGRHGFLIVELDPGTGKDLEPQVVVSFGHGVLAKAQEMYDCFPLGLPSERKRPPRPA